MSGPRRVDEHGRPAGDPHARACGRVLPGRPGYARLGDWRDRAGSTNIEETLLTGGWDKVVFLSEFYQLPAPLAEVVEDHTRVVLFAPRALSSMGRAERVRAVYLQACLRYVNRDYLTNASMRQRFGIDAHNSAKASRLIAEAVEAGVIVPDDPMAAPRFMRYVPPWASSELRLGT